MASHKVLVGINYRPTADADEVRAEPGDVVDDVPAKVAKRWVKAGVLETVTAPDAVQAEDAPVDDDQDDDELEHDEAAD